MADRKPAVVFEVVVVDEGDGHGLSSSRTSASAVEGAMAEQLREVVVAAR